MLSEIRERATGVIAYIIVIIIIIPFAFWGINRYFSGGQEVVVASVGDVDIQQADYRRTLDNRRRQMRQIMGENFNADLVDSPQFKRGVLDDMISRVLLGQHAKEYDYSIGDKQLAERIRSNPRFQDGDKFSSQAYKNQLASMGMTQTGFESSLRQQLVLQQLRDGIRDSAFVTPEEEQWLLRLLIQKRRFDYAVVDMQRFVDEQEVSDKEIKEEYDAHSDQYRTPEKMKVEYVELSVDKLAANVSVGDEEIKQLYEQNKERFKTDAVRDASHILIEVDQDAGEEAQQQAKEKAESLMDKLRNGANFAELAKEYSDDPGSAAKGGDLGRVEPGMMVKPFEDALFSLDKVGALAGPVKTRFGYHIIKLTGYEPPSVKPLEEVRDQLEKEERKKQAEAMFLDEAEAFRNVSYEQPQSLEPVADQLDLKIQQSDWFTRDNGNGIASNPQIREAAYGEEVRDEDLNSQAIELDMNTLVVLRKLEVQPAALQPLEAVRDGIVSQIKRRKAREHVAALGPDLVEQLRSDGAWESLLNERELTGQEVTLSRADRPSEDEPGPRPAVLNAVFRAPSPGDGKYVYGGVDLNDGDYVVFRLVEVIEGDADQTGDDVKKRVESSLKRRRSQDMVEEYIADLREQAEVTVKENAL